MEKESLPRPTEGMDRRSFIKSTVVMGLSLWGIGALLSASEITTRTAYAQPLGGGSQLI